jgi:hypothetical protein
MVMGRFATLESSRVRWPSQPASTNPAVELARVEDQRILVAHVHQLGQVLLVLADVDDPAGVVAEDPEVAVHMEIHRRRLDAALPQGVDDDAAGVERLTDGYVGENHVGPDDSGRPGWEGKSGHRQAGAGLPARRADRPLQ